MLKYISLLCLTIILISCGSNNSEKANTADTALNTTQETPDTGGNYFMLLKGSIDKYPVSLYLYARKQEYSGYYYYEAQQQPIQLYGNADSTNGKIVLTAYDDNDSTEVFTLAFTNGKATGNWQKGNKQLAVTLAQEALPLQFDYVGFADSVRLVDTMMNSPVGTAEIASVWPKGSTATDNFVKQQIALLFDEKQPKTAINNIMQAAAGQFLNEYKNDSDITKEEIQEFPERLNYDLSCDLRITYFTNSLLTLSFYNYAYSGGAHGNYGTTYRQLDLLHDKALQLKDILTTDGIKQLRPLLEKSFRNEQHLQPSQSLDKDSYLFENKIEPNENFYATGKGLIFSYQPYEIGPYAAGEITIMIPYQELQNYMQPSFQELLR